MRRLQDRLLQADRAMGLSHAPRPRVTDEAARPAQAPRANSPEAVPVVAPAKPAPQPRGVAAPTPKAIPAPVMHAEARPRSAEALDSLRERHDRECPHCTTATAHTRTVFGEGSATADLMFVGEAPGETEDRLGRPFVGPAGEKLDEMIRAMGLERGDVYIANVLKSRPPENRSPLQHEVDACGPYLIEQIRVIRPRVIVTLGGPATKLLLGTEEGITRLRGIWSEWRPPAAGEPIPVMPTYHPAYLLRNYTAKVRGEVWQDLQAVMQALGLRRAGGPG